MKTFVVCIFLAATAMGQQQAQRRPTAGNLDYSSDLSQPTPYEYAYTSENEEGSHGHSEKFDGVGRAEGNFFLKLADGRERHVTYVADENGFHPEIQTNELGTESKNTADAVYISSAPSGPDAAIAEYGGEYPETASGGSAGGVARPRASLPVANAQFQGNGRQAARRN